jgi:hypothetical protein
VSGLERHTSEQVCPGSIIEVGLSGEKVDVMTFRGSFERDVKNFAELDQAMTAAVADEDDDAVETIMNERFYHKPEMYYGAERCELAHQRHRQLTGVGTN